MNNIKFPWASQFIANHKSYRRYLGVSRGVRHAILRDTNLSREIDCAFEWLQTKEGHNYWKNIAIER